MNIVGAKNMTMNVPSSCHAACPKTKLHMRREINGAARRIGFEPALSGVPVRRYTQSTKFVGQDTLWVKEAEPGRSRIRFLLPK